MPFRPLDTILVELFWQVFPPFPSQRGKVPRSKGQRGKRCNVYGKILETEISYRRKPYFPSAIFPGPMSRKKKKKMFRNKEKIERRRLRRDTKCAFHRSRNRTALAPLRNKIPIGRKSRRDITLRVLSSLYDKTVPISCYIAWKKNMGFVP